MSTAKSTSDEAVTGLLTDMSMLDGRPRMLSVDEASSLSISRRMRVAARSVMIDEMVHVTSIITMVPLSTSSLNMPMR